MKGSYRTDREFSDRYLEEIKRIMGDLPHRLFNRIRAASFDEDTRRATDLVIFPFRGNECGARIRRAESFVMPRRVQFTIRSYRASGMETELAKIRKGMGSLFFYGFTRDE